MAIPPLGSDSIPPTPCLETNQIEEIQRYNYLNPLQNRAEFVRFYIEEGTIKGDTYSSRWNALIDRDIDIYLFCLDGKKHNIKNLTLEHGQEMLKLFNENTYVEVTGGRYGNASALTFV